MFIGFKPRPRTPGFLGSPFGRVRRLKGVPTKKTPGCDGFPVPVALPDSPSDGGNFACRRPDFPGLAGPGGAFSTFLNRFNKLPPLCELVSPRYPARLTNLGPPGSGATFDSSPLALLADPCVERARPRCYPMA